MYGIVELGHTGLWVNDLAVMRAFYVDLVGLHVTDEDLELGIVFLSARPGQEHHELVLQSGRTAPLGVQLINQISWRVADLESLIEYRSRLSQHDVRIQQIVTHGIAFGIYFFDPEGNRNEVYWSTGEVVQQPFRKDLDLTESHDEIFSAARRLLEDDQPRYRSSRT